MATVIVPMKKTNQRLPGKNIVSLGDKPLCYWLLGTLLACHEVSRIIVDVWGEEIAECVKCIPGAERIELSPRPIEYCAELAGGNFLLQRFVTKPDEVYVQCHVTSPFLKSSTLDSAISMINNRECDSCFGATQLNQRLWSMCNKDLVPINHDPSRPLARTQDLLPVYMENGSFFAFKGLSYLSHSNTRNCCESKPIPLTFPEVVDIDEEHDLTLARTIISSGLLNAK